MSLSRLRIPPFLAFLIVAIAVVNGLAEKYYWYWKFTVDFPPYGIIRWFDMPMHFSGGVWLAGMAVWLYPLFKTELPRPFSKILLICITTALGVGLTWEIYEAIISYITVLHINAMLDTLSDLLFDILGGTTVAIFTWWRIKQKQS